jgi:hypothetical protein
MDEKDPIENKFRSTFADYEQEPPGRVWENLQLKLHPVAKPVHIWRFANFRLITAIKPGVYLAFGGVALSLVFTMVFFGLKGHRAIRGHAYANEIRLHGGSAELFQVSDMAMPWDSVTHYRSAIIDHYGHFQFPRVRAGNYLLRVAPDGTSETAKTFSPSWYDRHETSDSCELIIISNGDVNLDVHLVKSREIAK